MYGGQAAAATVDLGTLADNTLSLDYYWVLDRNTGVVSTVTGADPGNTATTRVLAKVEQDDYWDVDSAGRPVTMFRWTVTDRGYYDPTSSFAHSYNTNPNSNGLSAFGVDGAFGVGTLGLPFAPDWTGSVGGGGTSAEWWTTQQGLSTTGVNSVDNMKFVVPGHVKVNTQARAWVHSRTATDPSYRKVFGEASAPVLEQEPVPVPTPEPTSVALLALGLGAIVPGRLRRARSSRAALPS